MPQRWHVAVCKLSSLPKKNIFLTQCMDLSAYVHVVSFRVAACECLAAVAVHVHDAPGLDPIPHVTVPPCERLSPTLRIFVSEMKALGGG